MKESLKKYYLTIMNNRNLVGKWAKANMIRVAMAAMLTMGVMPLNQVFAASASNEHYISVKSDNNTSPTTSANYNNDGALGRFSIAIGVDAQAGDAEEDDGSGHEGNTWNQIAIGQKAVAHSDFSIALGTDATTSVGSSAIAIGNQAVAKVGIDDATSSPVTAVGAYSLAEAAGASAFGSMAKASDSGATALGSGATASGNMSTAVGETARALNEGSVAVGANAYASTYYATALGEQAWATGMNATAVGSTAMATGFAATVVGSNASGEGYSVANGYYASAGLAASATGYQASAVKLAVANGYQAAASGQGSIAQGASASATNTLAIATGYKATAGGLRSTVVGANAKDNSEKGATVLGGDSSVSAGASFGTVVGYNSSVAVANGVAIGDHTIANTAAGEVGYVPAGASADESATWKSTLGAVSVGSGEVGSAATATRQITGVAAGTEDTDAVNVAQLKAATSNSGVHYYSVKSTETDEGTNYKNDGATGKNALAAGVSASAAGMFSTAVGASSSITSGTKTILFNYNVSATGATTYGAFNTIDASQGGAYDGVGNSVIGMGNTTQNSNGSLLWGVGNSVTNSYADLDAKKIAQYLFKYGDYAKAMQAYAKEAVGGDVLAIGGGNTADYAVNSALIGVHNTIKGTAGKSAEYNNVIGYNSSITNGSKDLVIGTNRVINGADGVVAIGSASSTLTTTAENAVIIGTDANVSEAGGVAVGANSVASTAAGIAGYDPAGATADESAVWKSTAAAVAVGDAANNVTRQITGVAAGTEDTDAVNVAQLKAAQVEVKAGDNVSVEKDTSSGHAVYTVSVDKEAIETIAKTQDTNTTNSSLEVSGEATKTITLTDSDNNQVTATFTDIDTNTETTVEAGTSNVTIEDKGTDGNHAYVISVNADKDTDTTYETVAAENGFTIKETGDNGASIGTVVGVDRVEITSGTDEDGKPMYTVNVNVDDIIAQMEVVDTNTTYTFEKGDTDAKGTTTYNIKGSDGTTATIEDHNTTNKSVTNKLEGSVLTTSITDSDGNTVESEPVDLSGITTEQGDRNAANINKLNNRVNKVGARAAALAALHPLDFDPDNKLTFAAGYGNYRGENAAAIGAFYRPDEKVMVSVGGTVSEHENMVNAGVSFSLDRTSHVTNSKTAMAKDIMALKEANLKQAAQIQALMIQNNKMMELLSAVTGKKLDSMQVEMFPDVPENHWAYNYIDGLQKAGIIEGVPSGNFEGDRSCTRYEFAAMLFRALKAGQVVPEQLMQEFKAELGRFRVDRVAGQDDDKNKVERVRVNTGKKYEGRDNYGSQIVSAAK